MRSLLECVSCLGTTTHEVSMMEEVVTVAVTLAREEEEETKSLMPADTTAASSRRRKTDRIRVRVGSTGSMNPPWKPSLCSITEDNIMAENRKKIPSETPTTVGRVVKRKSSSGSRSNVHVRSYSNDTGRNSVPVFLPTFSPTPFMF
ncbi:Organic cation/carnitine transporter4 isoform 1 [Hibiscus syriacus]|uniref:Organic cation/carnitine transporter4 isoform 1 n=1 Tax=Hibiscus syriacus TaxID=106335 RepID=A0A6A2WZF8_HIBSY|nr:uncharacterized protein LOC120179446 [Hibiscus syriacus]KAE8667308.1 Organic cation/carnitine transporter4 isoform 1 [Hibiscus syriacus]